MKSDDKEYIKMTQTPVPRLILSLAVPTIISMLVTSIYNMADTYFVSKLGTSASAATGIVFSLMAVIQAVGFTIGIGSGSTISRLLGQKRKEDADVIACSGLTEAMVFGVVLTVFGTIFIGPLMRLLGATQTILPYAKEYAVYILFAAPIMASSFVLNNILRAEGKAKFSMIGITTGGILNIILDPIFIFVFDLGIAGAAIATALSQLTSFFILISFFLRRKSILKLSLKGISRDYKIYVSIVRNGLASFCRQGLASISSVFLNTSAAVYGDAAVAAMSIVTKVFMMIFSVLIGIGQGYQPVVGYNYGAKIEKRVRQSFKFTYIIGTIAMFFTGTLGFIFAPSIMEWFISDDTAVISIGTLSLRCQCISMIFMPLNVITNMTFQSIGEPWKATLLSSCRQGLFFLPMIFILPNTIGLLGVQITQPAADFCTFLFTIPFIVKFFKKLKLE